MLPVGVVQHAQIHLVHRSIAAICAGLLLCGLIGCTTTGPAQPGAGMAATPSGKDDTLEQRLQALETELQQLKQRVEAVQAAVEDDRVGGRHVEDRADRLPEEYRPVRPGVVLASNPARMAKATVPPATTPVPAPAVAQPPQPALSPARDGDWVINLASYTSRTYASRKLAEFTGEGVAAEQVQAEVNGSTVYRLRVPGFASYRAASTESMAIRVQLGLNATWIARR